MNRLTTLCTENSCAAQTVRCLIPPACVKLCHTHSIQLCLKSTNISKDFLEGSRTIHITQHITSTFLSLTDTNTHTVQISEHYTSVREWKFKKFKPYTHTRTFSLSHATVTHFVPFKPSTASSMPNISFAILVSRNGVLLT
jgi:hypothetical protein